MRDTMASLDAHTLGRLLGFCRLVLGYYAVSWVLIDSEARHDRSQVLVEEELEVVWREIDVHRTEPDWFFAVLMKRLDRSRKAKRRDTPLLGMPCTSLVGAGESRRGLRMAAHPHPGTGEY
jgi:hypothetical protein